MAKVLSRIEKRLQESRQEIIIAYLNPRQSHIIDESPYFKDITENFMKHQTDLRMHKFFRIYKLENKLQS